jgi:pSer/pThr/pTyr-binding forkhead associated (FHA) protein
MARMILSLNGQTLAEYNLSKERYTVGRLADNDIRIDNPAVSGHHALVINILNDSFLEDLSSTNGTYVNGRLIKKHALQHGDLVTVGHHQLKFVDSELEDDAEPIEKTMVISRAEMRLDRLADEAAQEPASRPGKESTTQLLQSPPARLQILTGAFAGRELELKKPLTTLGRPGVQVVAVTRRGDSYAVIDMQRGNGKGRPGVNGEPLGPTARALHDNDVLEVAGVKMGFFTG